MLGGQTAELHQLLGREHIEQAVNPPARARNDHRHMPCRVALTQPFELQNDGRQRIERDDLEVRGRAHGFAAFRIEPRDGIGPDERPLPVAPPAGATALTSV